MCWCTYVDAVCCLCIFPLSCLATSLHWGNTSEGDTGCLATLTYHHTQFASDQIPSGDVIAALKHHDRICRFTLENPTSYHLLE
jgi:hypothetical protein